MVDNVKSGTLVHHDLLGPVFVAIDQDDPHELDPHPPTLYVVNVWLNGNDIGPLLTEEAVSALLDQALEVLEP